MQIKRISIDPLPQRNFKFAVGEPQMGKDAYSVAVVLAAVVRELLGNKHGSSTMVVSPVAVQDIVQQGAWLEIAEADNELIIRVALK